MPPFTSAITPGRGRGRTLGFPTLNLSLPSIPRELTYGVYVCRVTLNDDTTHTYKAVMHYGPRSTFADSVSCEVHIIDATLDRAPDSIMVTVTKKIRDIEHFASKEELQKQIARDILVACGINGEMRVEDPR